MDVKMKLVAENRGSDLGLLPQYEDNYKEGDRGEIRLYLNGPVSPDVMQEIEDELLSEGVILTENIKQDAGIMTIRFRKGIAPLAIAAIVLGGIAAIGGGLLGWQIFKTTQAGVPLWVWGIGIAAVLYLIFTSEPAKATGRASVKAGKYVGQRYVEQRLYGGGGRKSLPNHQLPLQIEGGDYE